MNRQLSEVNIARVVVVLGHRAVGKTSLVDAVLHSQGVTRQLGSVEDGTSFMDFTKAERRREMSLWPSVAWVDCGQVRTQLVDLPGAEELEHDRLSAASGAEAALIVVTQEAADLVGSLNSLKIAERFGLPAVIVLNKLDVQSQVDVVAEKLTQSGGIPVVPIQLPMHDHEGEICGFVDIIERTAVRFSADHPERFSIEPLPRGLFDEVERARSRLEEMVAVTDEELLEQYLEFFELDQASLRAGLRQAIASRALLPLVVTAATTGVGVEALLENVDALLPVATGDSSSETEVVSLFSAVDNKRRPFTVLRVNKGQLMHNSGFGALYQLRGERRARAGFSGPGALIAVKGTLQELNQTLNFSGTDSGSFELALEVTGEADLKVLTRLIGLAVGCDPALKATKRGVWILRGLGFLHLDRWLALFRDEFGLDVTTSRPPVGYRERPAKRVEDVTGIHRGQIDGELSTLGSVDLTLYPLQDGAQCHFTAETTEDVLPLNLSEAVGRGCLANLNAGPLLGLPVIGVGMVCTSGDYDYFEATEKHLELAGAAAVEAALQNAGTEIVEPWSRVEICADSSFVGGLLADVASHGGRVIALEFLGKKATLQAEYPDRELRSFENRLSNITSGSAQRVVQHSHYKPLPKSFLSEARSAAAWMKRTGAMTLGSACQAKKLLA